MLYSKHLELKTEKLKVLDGKLPTCKVNCKALGLFFRKEDIEPNSSLKLLGKSEVGSAEGDKFNRESDKFCMVGEDNPQPNSTNPFSEILI